MAKEDFCFTYYDGDAARDKAHMTRLERGAYDDIISAQRKFGHLSLMVIKKTLGSDFDTCWFSLELILKVDDEGKYYIEWVKKSVEKAQSHSKKQKDNAGKRWQKKEEKTDESMPPHASGISQTDANTYAKPMPLEDGDGNGDEDENVVEDFGKSENLLPKMFAVWKKHNPTYPGEEASDFPALREISEFICKQSGIPYQPREPDVHTAVLHAWDTISAWVAADKFYRGHNLQQISKYRQSIVKKISDEASSSKGKPGAKSTGAQLDEAFNKFYSKGQHAAASG